MSIVHVDRSIRHYCRTAFARRSVAGAVRRYVEHIIGNEAQVESGEGSPSGAAAGLVELLMVRPEDCDDEAGFKAAPAKRQPPSRLVVAE